jgi:preprotein translocase subunit SecA
VFALRIVQSMAGDIAVAGSAMANHIRNLRGLRTGNHKDVILNEWRLANTQPVQDIDPRIVTSPRKKVGRNEPCPCGSGKKYKKCCGLN